MNQQRDHVVATVKRPRAPACGSSSSRRGLELHLDSRKDLPATCKMCKSYSSTATVLYSYVPGKPYEFSWIMIFTQLKLHCML
jgi:hypothetical protein